MNKLDKYVNNMYTLANSMRFSIDQLEVARMSGNMSEEEINYSAAQIVSNTSRAIVAIGEELQNIIKEE